MSKRQTLKVELLLVLFTVFIMIGGQQGTVHAAVVVSHEHYDSATKTLTISQLESLTAVTSITSTQKYKEVEHLILFNVKSIGEGVFDSWTQLKSVEFKSSDMYTTSIGKNAFRDCRNLTTITLPSTLTTMGDTCFSGCKKLLKLTIPKSVKTLGKNCFSTSGIKELTMEGTATQISEYAFASMRELEKIKIPDTVTSIGNYAFYECYALKKLELPANVKTIGSYCFDACTGLEEIKLPSGLEKIDSYAFQDCAKLSKVTIPKGLKTLGSYVFRYSKVKEVYFEEGTTVILSNMLSICESVEKVVMPDSVQTIKSYAFYHCKNLKSIRMSKNLTSIGYYGFYGCYSLEKISIAKGIETTESLFSHTGIKEITFEEGRKTIPKNFCKGCRALVKVNLPASLETIERQAFSDCSMLETIYLPKNLTTIQSYAFEECGKLKAVDILADNVTIKTDAFYGDPEMVLYGVYNSTLHKYCLENKKYKFVGKYKDLCYVSVQVQAESPRTGNFTKAQIVIKDNGKTLTENKDYTVKYINNKALGTATVTITGKSPYYGSVSRTFRIVPGKNEVYKVSNLKYKVTNTNTKGQGCVTVTGLVKKTKKITIPKTVKIAGITYKVTAIGKKAFYKQSTVKKITIQSTAITSIGTRAFYGINKKATIYVPKKCYKTYKKNIEKSKIAKTVKVVK